MPGLPDDVDAIAHALSDLGLHDKRAMTASNLTLPDRKRLEVARALATGPRLLLLDEVMAGLRPTETDQMVTFLRELNARTGLTILLIEHVMRAVMALSQHIVVLNYGEKIAEGPPDAIARALKCQPTYFLQGMESPDLSDDDLVNDTASRMLADHYGQRIALAFNAMPKPLRALTAELLERIAGLAREP